MGVACIQVFLAYSTDRLARLLSPILKAKANLELRFNGAKEAQNVTLELVENTSMLTIVIIASGRQVAKDISIELQFDSCFKTFSSDLQLLERHTEHSTYVNLVIPFILYPRQEIGISLRCEIDALQHELRKRDGRCKVYWVDHKPRDKEYDLPLFLKAKGGSINS